MLETIAINAIIVINSSYKISITYCSIKMQIVIILRIHWAYYNSKLFQTLSIDIWQLKCQQRQTNKTKNMANVFFHKLFRIIKFFFLNLLREASLESKVAPTNRNSSAFLLHPSKTFSSVRLFSIISETFLELVFAIKIKTMLLKQPAVLLTSCQKNIAYIICLNTSNIVHK